MNFPITDNKEKVNSTLLGMYISLNMITKIITAFYSFENNLVLVVSSILICSLIYNKFKINIVFLLFNSAIGMVLFFSTFRMDDTTYLIQYFNEYMIYGLVATYLVSFKVNFERVMTTVNFIFYAFTIILILFFIPKIETNLNLDFTMDLSYSSLIGVTSLMLSTKIKRETLSYLFIKALTLIVNLWFILVLSNNRGAIFTLMILFLLILVHRIKRVKFRFLILFISLIFSTYLIINMEKIILVINKLVVNYFYLKVNWLNRFVHQIEMGNILSGREELYRKATELIQNKPIFGGGIGYFESLNNGQYPHNILLQLLVEFGIIIGFFIILLFLLSFIQIMFRQKNNQINLIIFFFVLSVPRLMISSSYWSVHFFWMYVFLSILILNPKSYKAKLKKFDK